MNILVANAGSSSVRLRLLDDDDHVLAEAHEERRSGDPDGFAVHLDAFLSASTAAIDVIGHRVVHGGSRFVAPQFVDARVERELSALVALAPLHQPPALQLMRDLAGRLPGVPHVACFDTAFHTTLPPEAFTYALPLDWRSRWGLRRFGFHGLSHAWAARRLGELEDTPLRRIVVCHLGAGASLCAVLDGRSVDTTMGFTPLDGLVMASRSGSVDPGLVLWLITEAGMDPADVERGLRTRSGLSGLVDGEGDMRSIVTRRAAGDRLASDGFDVYVHRLISGIASMAASLEGLDGLVFTGGVGENSPAVRAAAASRLSFLGVGVDESRNAAGSGDRDISSVQARVRTFVVHAREDLEIARGVRTVMGDPGSTSSSR